MIYLVLECERNFIHKKNCIKRKGFSILQHNKIKV